MSEADLMGKSEIVSWWWRGLLILLLVTSMAVAVTAQRGPVRGGASQVAIPAPPTPEDALGFKPGADRQLALWQQLLSYYRQLDRSSDRLRMDEIGRTTLGRPMVMLAVSSPANLARLDDLKQIQQQLSDPRRPPQIKADGKSSAESLVNSGRVFILVSGGGNPVEVGGALAVTALVRRLTTDHSPEVARILDQVVVLFVPTLNPDGLDIVTNWYRKTLGTPAEGTDPPELVHPYAGQDLGQDWNALTQVETRLMVEKVFNVWRPQVWLDLRQSGRAGARFTLTYQSDRLNSTVARSLVTAIKADLTRQGRAGVTADGGRSLPLPNLYAGLAIRSEAASVRLSTPVNFQSRQWSLGDIVDYQSDGVMALLRRAALDRLPLLKNFQAIAAQSVVRDHRKRHNPFAILLLEPEVPKSISEAYQRLNSGLREVAESEEEMHQKSEALYDSVTGEPSSSLEVRYFYQSEGVDRLLGILKTGGVEVLRATEPFNAGGQSYPAGTHIVPLRQPGATFASQLLASGEAASALPLLLNVRTVPVDSEFSYHAVPEPPSIILQGRVRENGGVRVGLYRNHLPAVDEGWTRWIFDQYRFGYQSIYESDLRAGGLQSRFDAIIIPDQAVAELGRRPDSVGVPGGLGEPGLGDSELGALRDFCIAGGTLVTLNRASSFLIKQFKLPVRNVLTARTTDKLPDNLPASGSILRLDVETANPLGFGVGRTSIAWFEKGPVFEITDPKRARAIATYTGSGEPEISGRMVAQPAGNSLLRQIRGRAALVEVLLGKGRVVLFGFRPQYRGQSLATYPFLFNALMTSGQ
jgi:hypothetical protein